MVQKVRVVQIDVDGDLFRECIDAIERIGKRVGYGLMESVATVDEILVEVNAKPRQYKTSGGPTQQAFYKRTDIVKVLTRAIQVGFVRVLPAIILEKPGNR